MLCFVLPRQSLYQKHSLFCNWAKCSAFEVVWIYMLTSCSACDCISWNRLIAYYSFAGQVFISAYKRFILFSLTSVVINRVAMGWARFIVCLWFILFFPRRPDAALDHAICIVYSKRCSNINTRTMLKIFSQFSLLCVKYIFVWLYRSIGFEGSNKYSKKVLHQPSNALMLQLLLSLRDR